MKNSPLNFLLTVLLFLSLIPGAALAQELNLAPDCGNASASPSSLWPVNHKFVDIDILGVTDPDSDPFSVEVQCILQDEELNASGDGNFIYDGDGIDTPTASLRSERSGNNNGRVYHIDFIATDSSGARCGGEVLVSVPHNSEEPAIDEGRLFKSVPSDNSCGQHDINNDPWIYSEPVLTGSTSEQYRYDVNGHDPDQDVLTYSIVSGHGAMSIDAASGLLSWTDPEAGVFSITVRIDDQRGGTDEQIYQLFINGPPRITSTPVTEVPEGKAYSYQMTAVDPNEDDQLSYSLKTGPQGLDIDPQTGLVAWASPLAGEYTVAVQVSDNHGASDEQTYTLTVIPPPTVTLVAAAEEIKAGESTTLTWSSTNADALTLEPGIGSVGQSGIISVAPAATTTYTITAVGRGGSASAAATITVSAPSIDLAPVAPGINDASCPDSVNLLVQLKNIGEGPADAGIAVTFYNGDPQNGGLPIGTARSAGILESGAAETVSLQWPNPPVGKATIHVKVDDTGNGTGEVDETDEENNVISFAVSLCEELPDPDANSISGEVIDAVTGARLSNVTVELHLSENGFPGPVIASFLTNYEGVFIFRDLAPGTYIITGTVDGYADGERQANLTKGAVLQHQDLVLSPLLVDDDIRIILTWGQYPEDLEAHLTAPNAEGCRHHCFYWNQEIPGANLDLDDRHSYGPETITITDPVTGTYRYYVHNFSNRTSLSNYSLSYYGAEVKVYLAGQAEPLVFKTPTNRYTRGTVWHVFDLDGEAGEITPVNKFTHQVEPGQIDFPRISSSPGYHPNAYWGTPYKYQVTAEDPDDDVLTYTLLQGPEGMTIDPNSGLLEWTPLGIPASKYLISIKASDGRCGEDTQTFYLYVYSTPAASFSADPCSAYNENGDITLSWSTSYAKTVHIDQGIGEVAAAGSLTIPSPESPKVYTLTALNDAAATIRRMPSAPPNPGISLSPNVIEPTHSAKLNWNCGCAATCEIDQGIG
ncbi:MAG: putative Ig domain-containing protein, partial [Desulfobulbaceae bacterium]